MVDYSKWDHIEVSFHFTDIITCILISTFDKFWAELDVRNTTQIDHVPYEIKVCTIAFSIQLISHYTSTNINFQISFDSIYTNFP